MMEPLKPSKYVIVERIATGATVLIWIGVLLMAVGLTMVYRQMRVEQQAVAQAESLAFVVVETATPTASPTATASLTPTDTPIPTDTPTPTDTLTPTYTPLPPTPTPGLIDAFVFAEDVRMILRTHRLVPTRTPTPTPTSTPTATPVPTPTPTEVTSASAPPDRLVIPSINLDVPVVPVGWHIEEQGGLRISVWDSPDNAAGWHKTSAYPSEPGNVVLNGHNNIRGEVFRYLIEVEPKAHILLYVGDTVYYYSVSEKHLLKERGEPPKVRLQNAQWISLTEDERLTLVTCWPYTSNTHRLIIVARPYQPDLLLLE